MKKPKEKKRSGVKKALITIGILLLVLLLIAGAGLYVVNRYMDRINRVDPNEEPEVLPESETFETDESTTESTAPPLDPSEVEWEKEETVTFDDSGLLNILLVGQDRREGQGRQRSDTMILCSINTKTNEVSMISFLRDLYVQIPGGYSPNRLNASYAFGGFPLLNKTMNQNFGVTIDGNIEVDFEGFTTVIDQVGGVDITLTKKEAAYLRLNDGKAGTVHLNGYQALEYARIRKLDSDFGRTQRQRNVLMAVFSKVRAMSVGEIKALVDTILPTLTTDMSNTELLSLVTQLAPMLAGMEIHTYRVPANDAYRYASIRGMSVLVPDLNKIRTDLRDEYLPFD